MGVHHSIIVNIFINKKCKRNSSSTMMCLRFHSDAWSCAAICHLHQAVNINNMHIGQPLVVEKFQFNFVLTTNMSRVYYWRIYYYIFSSARTRNDIPLT